MPFNLDQFIYALSDSVDLVGVDEIMHSKRVGCMAWHCARQMGASEAGCKRLLYLGLLHDCGVSSTVEHRNLVNELDWENSQNHCIIGAKRMSSFEPLSDFSDTVLYHHTHWQSLKTTALPEKIKQEANLIYLLDRVDYLAQNIPGPNWLLKKDDITKKIKAYRGSNFHSSLVDLFIETAQTEAFWLSLEPQLLTSFIETRKKEAEPVYIGDAQLKTIAGLFAQIVDAKSPYTAEHSIGTAALAGFLARKAGQGGPICRKIEAAGLLHDIGKLNVPDRILEKPGRLDTVEMSIMHHHSYISHQIISRIDGLEDIAQWTANHHEALDGSGYPFRRTAEDLDEASRIIAIADIFQALAQDRPYRPAQPVQKIISILSENAAKGRLDMELVGLVIDNTVECYSNAVQH